MRFLSEPSIEQYVFESVPPSNPRSLYLTLPNVPIKRGQCQTKVPCSFFCRQYVSSFVSGSLCHRTHPNSRKLYCAFQCVYLTHAMPERYRQITAFTLIGKLFNQRNRFDMGKESLSRGELQSNQRRFGDARHQRTTNVDLHIDR